MSLFRRNKRAREEGDEAAAEPGLPRADAAAPTAEQTAVAEPIQGDRDPAQLDALVGEAPNSRRRGKLRRRLRHLRRVREVLLRDLGGLAFELHRSGMPESGPVLEGKLARLAMVDRELRELEAHLEDHRAMIVREPGIGGTCAECGELFGSEARFCWACGNPVAVGAQGAPHLAAWTTHPQLTGGGQWVDPPTAPLPQMDPGAVEAETPAANEPATGDVGGEGGAAWTEADVVEPRAPAEPAPAAAAPAAEPAEPAPARSGDSAAAPAAPAAEPAEPARAPADPGPPTDWLPREREEDQSPDLSSGDPLAGPPRQAGQ